MNHVSHSATFTAPSVSIPSISSSAMLVELNISVWTGRKFDKVVSQEIDTAKQTTTRAGNYHKNLIADEPIFTNIGKFQGNARTYHYHATMPWSDSGMRLLTTPMYFDYHKTVSQMEMDFDNLVIMALNDYPNMILRAKHRLGDLFNEHDYPDVDDLRNKYRFSVKFSPVPDVGDWRVDIGNDAQQVLKESYANAYSANLELAYKDIWTRTHEALLNMSSKLSGNNKQIFRDSLVSNVKDMVDLLDKFNVTDDPKMKEAKAKIQSALVGITPDALREDDDLRLDTKSKVDELLKEFSW
jgi:hypothetical protein